jgi:hypothetical protein
VNASTYLARGSGSINIISHLKNKHEKLSFARSHRQSFGNSEAISNKLMIIKATQFIGRMIKVFTNAIEGILSSRSSNRTFKEVQQTKTKLKIKFTSNAQHCWRATTTLLSRRVTV